MSAGAEEVHGITKEMVENSGKYLTEVIEEFDNIIRDADIAGYNSNSLTFSSSIWSTSDWVRSWI